MRWELAPPGGVPCSYGFDAIACVKVLEYHRTNRLRPDNKKTLCLMLLQKQ